MARHIFVSLTHSDTSIAEALREALNKLFGDFLTVHFSTSKEAGGGITSGEDWFEWIVNKVVDCDFAFILITPASAHKPWILWEAGAVAGAALASQEAKTLRKVRPLVYQLPTDMIPSPIRDSKVQFRRGDDKSDVEQVLNELLLEYLNAPDLPGKHKTGFGRAVDGVIDDYMTRVNKALLDAPAVPTAAMLDEWRQRLNDFLAKDRASEVRYLHDWMDIAFGRVGEKRPRPLDLGIHTRLGNLYMKARDFDRAIEQFEFARDLAPRDIFVLRMLGQAHLEKGKREAVQALLDRINELDKNAFRHNTECAALLGRFHRKGGDPKAAAEVYRTALGFNSESHYLANLLAEASLEAGDKDGAGQAYRQVLTILTRLNEANVWTHASAANASFFVDDQEGLSAAISAIRALNVGSDELASIERGLETVAKHVDGGEAKLRQTLALLRA